VKAQVYEGEAPKRFKKGRRCECGAKINMYSGKRPGEKKPRCYRCRQRRIDESVAKARAEAERKAQPRDQHGIPLPSLRAIRFAAGISQKKLAPLVGCSYGVISHLERGKHGAREEIAQKLAAVLGVSVEDLMRETRMP
jgi:DNA-binding XRE family transcriptional regulator